MSIQLASMFTSKVNDLLNLLLTNHIENFSNELLNQINQKKISSIEDIQNIWNSVSGDKSLNVNFVSKNKNVSYALLSKNLTNNNFYDKFENLETAI